MLNAAERGGRLNLRTEDITSALPGLGAEALRQALHRQQRRGRLVRLSRGSGHWLIVPMQYAEAGAPPFETWLHRYLAKTLEIPYYVALLSAAEIYGASPYAVMMTQVMVPKPRRSMTVGRHEIVFHTRARIEQMPTRWHETPDGRFKVSSPELTALELVQREAVVGGLARVREVLHGLASACSIEGLNEALAAVQEAPAAQRLGALLTLDGQETLGQCIADWLQTRSMRIVPLDAEHSSATATKLDTCFKVRMPNDFKRSNS
jgi:predicted transcriptional regulator of viral defense system